MANVVLVVDMFRGFLEEGYPQYRGDRVRSIIPSVQSLLEQEVAKGSNVFFIGDHHILDDPAGRGGDTVESEVIPELACYQEEVIPRRPFGGFFDTLPDETLSRLNPEKVTVCGTGTDICVLHAVSEVIGFGYQVEVPVDCVAASDEKAHQFGLEYIENTLGAKLTKLSTKLD